MDLHICLHSFIPPTLYIIIFYFLYFFPSSHPIMATYRLLALLLSFILLFNLVASELSPPYLNLIRRGALLTYRQKILFVENIVTVQVNLTEAREFAEKLPLYVN